MSSVMISSKITPSHLARRAIVYVRQSTEHQVRHNLESQRLQYDLAERARALGWQHVETIDADLGQGAGVGAARRAGFDHLLASVARGEVGIVLAREMSRLSRNDKDFCHLIELCQVFGSLLGDGEQVYDPALMDDQLVLGIKGTLSVVELRVLRMRLTQGQQAKAKRGELRRGLPVGYAYDGDGKVVLDPDERVRHAIQIVFQVFRQTWSVRQTVLRLHTDGIQVPVRRPSGPRTVLTWKLPRPSFIAYLLHNPWYAGAYVWGRAKMEHVYRDGRLVKRMGRPRPPDQCAVLLWDRHDAYISRAEFDEHLRIMSRNSHAGGDASSIRTGVALLAGMLRCGRCGRRLNVRYWSPKGAPGRYMCAGTFDMGGKYCLALSGGLMDRTVSAEVLRVLSPLGTQASLAALEQCHSATDGPRKALALQVQQLDYDVRRAREQYDEVDPRNRLVAAELERRWNDKLEQLQEARTALAALGEAKPARTDAERQAIVWLGEHFATAWHSGHCPMELRKKLVRTVIEDIVVDASATEIHCIVHWRGGTHTRINVARPAWRTTQANAPDDIQIIGLLAPRYSDEQIGRVLSRLGHHTGKGMRWTRQAVKAARNKAAIPGGDHPRADPDVLSLNAAARHLGVSDTTIRRLVETGKLINRQTVPWAPWEVRRQDLEADPVRGIVEHLRRTGRLVLEPVRLAEQPELFP